MSMPQYQNNYPYQRRFYGGQSFGNRVRVGRNYVYSSTPRPGFRPSKYGGGFYKRRTY